MKYKYRENQHLDHAMRKLAAIQLLLSRLGGLKTDHIEPRSEDAWLMLNHLVILGIISDQWLRDEATLILNEIEDKVRFMIASYQEPTTVVLPVWDILVIKSPKIIYVSCGNLRVCQWDGLLDVRSN